jgi:microcompartment protein CcmK/EutM
LLTQVFECVVARQRQAQEVVHDGVGPGTHEASRLVETTSSREATRSAA